MNAYIKKIMTLFTLLFVVSYQSAQCKSMSAPAVMSAKALALNQALRKLWSEHVFWTHIFIVSATTNGKDKDAAASRLFKNQEDLGNAIVPFYGAQAGAKLAALLKDHIKIAAEIVEAAMKNDQKTFKNKDKEWKKNALDIAILLSSANPHWSQDDLNAMLNEHLALLAQDLTMRLKKQWQEDVIKFDEIYNQALEMADEFTRGIVKQFPNKF